MSLEEKSNAVEEIFLDLDKEIKQFQNWSSLGCQLGCGKCCFKPDIEATPLEFLPFAIHLNKIGKGEEWLSKIEHLDDPKICVILNPTQSGVGLCSEYMYRGLICRLFGFSARTNKYEKKELVTCSIIKEKQPMEYGRAVSKINEGAQIPVMSEYYLKMHYVDPVLANDFMPINAAIKKAIQLVLQNAYYKNEEVKN
jgi:uncharacterized protein